MHRSKIIITLGIVVAIMPLLGFPHAWESVLQVLLGLSISGLSVWSIIDKRLGLKARARSRQLEKRKALEVTSEAGEPTFPNEGL
ncbi:hypothetical protein GW944_01125 [Candidatus Parcubacteria bacterium]|nr:hypothetical protein [Candidatus Parcubacteria bacterium]